MNGKKYTLLHEACYIGIPNLVKLYMKYGSDVNAQTSVGNTPLVLLCGNKNKLSIPAIIDIIELFITKNVSFILTTERKNYTILHHLCEQRPNNILLIAVLLEYIGM